MKKMTYEDMKSALLLEGATIPQAAGRGIIMEDEDGNVDMITIKDKRPLPEILADIRKKAAADGEDGEAIAKLFELIYNSSGTFN